MKIVLVAGARPNFMKIAPIMKAMKGKKGIEPLLVHTGQHYDEKMSKVFFDDLDIPKPDINLEVGSGSHAWQTAEIMKKFEKILLEERPDLVMVVGDVNSTIACSLVAAKMHIRVAHVEAGLRSNNWKMPEEVNRVLTDRLSDYLFTTCRDADENLAREGIDREKIFFVGNVMIDSLLQNRKKADGSTVLEELDLPGQDYGILTLHRPSNVDNRHNLEKILGILENLPRNLKIIYPAHPRTRKKLEEFGLMDRLMELGNLEMIDPRGYHDFLKLMDNAKVVLTDSGGIQEETTILGVPCLTMRGETERPITITEGTNEMVGLNRDLILDGVDRIMSSRWKENRIPELWDGKAAERIVRILEEISS